MDWRRREEGGGETLQDQRRTVAEARKAAG
jgi:hypothetical protein